MPRKSNREKEIEAKIKEWEEELSIWEKNNSEAGIVERRNLLNLISNAKKEIEEMHTKKKGNNQEELGEQTFEEIKKEYEAALEEIEKESKERNVQMNVLKLRIERLKEEQKIYVGNKDLFEEYEENIGRAEEELIKLASADNAITKKELESKISKAKDSSIKKVTLLRIKKEKEINDIKNKISAKEQEVQEVLAQVEAQDRMTKITLEDGSTIETPKVLEIYKEIDALKDELRVLQKEVGEYQNYINLLKGIEEKVEARTLEPEEVRYYHGQGDMQERGDNGSKENVQANDDFFGIDRGSKTSKKEQPSKNNPEGPNNPGKGNPEGPNNPGKGNPEGPNNPGRGNPEGPSDIFSNTYPTAIDEYKKMLEIYKEDLERLYELQAQYENDTLPYADYKKYADYMVERYRFIQKEYGKVSAQYESEKNKSTKSNVKTILQWHPDLTEEQIDYIKSELDIYEPVGEEYHQALLQLGLDPSKQPEPIIVEEQQNSNNNKSIPQWHPDLTEEQIDYIKSELEIYEPVGDEYIQALLQLGLDPSKQPEPIIVEEQQNNNDINNIPQWHPDLTEEQIDYIKSELDIYEPVGDEYIQALLQLGLDPSKQPKVEENRSNGNIALEVPEKPEQPMMILEKEKEDDEIPPKPPVEPEIDYDAIQEEYAYRKQDMVYKFMGNRERAKEYDERLNRFRDNIVEAEFRFVDEQGQICTGTYQTIAEYPEYEEDAFFLQLEEYKDRLEDMTKFDAGDKSVYKDVRVADRVITAQEQRDRDNEYIKTYNHAYNSHVHTQNNLMTLGNYGDKVPYSKFEQKQPVRNILRAAGNVLKFTRNWTVAPVSRFVGKRIVAPIHKAIYKPEESNPNPYKSRLTHRYEQRKNYFKEQGKGYFSSTFSALFKYEEGNRGALEARGGEIYKSIERKHTQLAQKDAELRLISEEIDSTEQEISKISRSLELAKGEEKAALQEKLEQLNINRDRLENDANNVLSRRVSQTIQTDAVDTKTHDRANKRTITRAVTTIKALSIGATKYFGPKLHRYILDKTQTPVVTWKQGPDSIVYIEKLEGGNLGDIEVGDLLSQDMDVSYAADGIAPFNNDITPEFVRGFAVKDGLDTDGFTSFIDGNQMTAEEIARIADYQLPAHLLDSTGNLSKSTKLIDLAKEVGIEIKSKTDMENFINNLELCCAESGTGIGHKAGWSGKLFSNLKVPIDEGRLVRTSQKVSGKLIQVINYVDNPTLKKIFGMVEKGTDAVIIADAIDQIYENVRETQGKGKAFKENRPKFDDQGKTSGPIGFDYDRKGRNKIYSCVPTYSAAVVYALGAQSIQELKDRLANIDRAELTDEEIYAINSRTGELLEKSDRTPRGKRVKEDKEQEQENQEQENQEQENQGDEREDNNSSSKKEEKDSFEEEVGQEFQGISEKISKCSSIEDLESIIDISLFKYMYRLDNTSLSDYEVEELIKIYDAKEKELKNPSREESHNQDEGKEPGDD